MVAQIHKADCAHTFCHSGSLSHTDTYKYSSQHSVKEGGVGFGRGGGIITWYFFDLYFWVQRVDFPASVGCKTSGSTDRKPYEFLVVVRAEERKTCVSNNFYVHSKIVTHSVGNYTVL